MCASPKAIGGAAAGDRRFDLAVANPPYIAEGDPHLRALRHEPQHALVAGEAGLHALARSSQGAPQHLSRAGCCSSTAGTRPTTVRQLLSASRLLGHRNARGSERPSALHGRAHRLAERTRALGVAAAPRLVAPPRMWLPRSHLHVHLLLPATYDGSSAAVILRCASRWLHHAHEARRCGLVPAHCSSLGRCRQRAGPERRCRSLDVAAMASPPVLATEPLTPTLASVRGRLVEAALGGVVRRLLRDPTLHRPSRRSSGHQWSGGRHARLCHQSGASHAPLARLVSAHWHARAWRSSSIDASSDVLGLALPGHRLQRLPACEAAGGSAPTSGLRRKASGCPGRHDRSATSRWTTWCATCA